MLPRLRGSDCVLSHIFKIKFWSHPEESSLWLVEGKPGAFDVVYIGGICDRRLEGHAHHVLARVSDGFFQYDSLWRFHRVLLKGGIVCASVFMNDFTSTVRSIWPDR